MKHFVATLFICTLICSPAFAQDDLPIDIPGVTITADGGQIDLTTFPFLSDLGMENLFIIIPAGAVTEEVTVHVSLPTTIPTDLATLQAIELTIEGHTGQFDFETPITIGIPYPETVEDETILTIQLWDAEGEEWIPIELIDTIVVDTEQNFVTAQITHFSVYGVLESEAEEPGEEPAVESVEIYPGTPSVVAGGTIQFEVEVKDADGEDVEDAEVVWEVENAEIGTIENGLFTALTVGETTVTATVGELSSEAEVTVTEAEEPGEEPAVESVEIYPGTPSVVAGGTIQFEVEVKDADGEDVEDAEVVWEVENAEIGTIENGLFTALTVGETTVTATVGELSGEAEVTVTEEGTPLPEGVNTIDIRRQLPNGNITRFGSTVTEGATVTIAGIPHPLNFLNGMKLTFPEGCLDDDITITFKLPEFGKVDNQKKEVSFDDEIVTAVTFEVTVDDVVISPYPFVIPLELSLPYKRGLLNNLGIEPEDLGMFFVTESGLTEEGIKDIAVDLDANRITGNVEHFSDVALAPKNAATIVQKGAQPEAFTLSQNYPNPFNPETTITFDLSEASRVNITIYNVLGQHVRTLVNELKPAGTHSLVWNGKNDAGERVTNGVYLYRMEAGSVSVTRKLILMK